jgi:hypothetical protein
MAEAKSKDGMHLLKVNDAELNTIHFGTLLALKQAASGSDIALPTIKNAIAIHEAVFPITEANAKAAKKSEKN